MSSQSGPRFCGGLRMSLSCGDSRWIARCESEFSPGNLRFCFLITPHGQSPQFAGWGSPCMLPEAALSSHRAGQNAHPLANCSRGHQRLRQESTCSHAQNSKTNRRGRGITFKDSRMLKQRNRAGEEGGVFLN
uniref:Uncharacterized protein n=1 Tax=Molossus molossus TaxID=27622 RepID=A0A7J8DBS7_MOLMO|nr:hypothetical protein HJG59_009366 [Molossus molossus]